MRILCLLFLVILVGAVVAFAYYNQEPTTVRFMDWSVTASLAVVAAAAYLLGMFSGWSVVGVIRRSASRVIQRSNSSTS
jgi:uncharacterized integral membrane protein